MQLLKKSGFFMVYAIGLLCVTCSFASHAQIGAVEPVELRCEYAANPLGIDAIKPRLSWLLSSRQRDQKQTAYQVLVAGRSEKLATDNADIWDSGKVVSEKSVHVIYDGRPLESGKKYFWKVRVWDKNGRPSKWSQPAHWSMGLLQKADWKAKWIAYRAESPWKIDWYKRKKKEREKGLDYSTTPQWELYKFPDKPYDSAPLLRKSFRMKSKVRQAQIYVCGLGYYELRINGRKVGDHVLDPAWTNYNETVLYETYDVTDSLRNGENVLGIMLGRGWYNMITDADWDVDKASWLGQPKAIIQLEINFTDGTKQTVISDESWKVTGGPIIWNCVRAGEIYDARRERPGWDKPDYDDSAWAKVAVVSSPWGALKAQMMPPIKVMKTLRPVYMRSPEPGVYVYDTGRNFAGWVRLKIDGPRGTRVVVSITEQDKDGNLEFEAGARRYQQNTYILKGQGREVYEPHFTYYAGRYIRLEGYPGKPSLDSIEVRCVRTAMEKVGEFECSEPLLSRLYDNTVWTMENLVHGYPEDCPHREKLGWTDHGILMAEAAMWNFDTALFHSKWLDDFKDFQDDAGGAPYIVPKPAIRWARNGEIAWSGAYLFVPWHMYKHYGDTRIIEQHYDGIKRWFEALPRGRWKVEGNKYLLDGNNGDWVPPENGWWARPPEGAQLVSTGYYLRGARIMSKFAEILGKKEEAANYRKLAQNIEKAFNKAYLDEATSTYHTNVPAGYRQTSNIIPLLLSIVPKGHEQQVLGNLVDDIMIRHNGHLSTGTMGTSHLMDTLAAYGRGDVAYRVVSQRTFPSWGWWIAERGATTSWECWDVCTSNIHSCFVSVGSYFHKWLAGIRLDDGAAGFERVIIEPGVVSGLQYAKGSVKTVRGVVSSSWRRNEDCLMLDVQIPVGSAGRVRLPKMGFGNVSVKESNLEIWKDGKFVEGVEGVKMGKDEGEFVEFEVGSGSYSFWVEKQL